MDTPPLPKYTVPPGQFKCPFCQTDADLLNAAKELRDATRASKEALAIWSRTGSGYDEYQEQARRLDRANAEWHKVTK